MKYATICFLGCAFMIVAMGCSCRPSNTSPRKNASAGIKTAASKDLKLIEVARIEDGGSIAVVFSDGGVHHQLRYDGGMDSKTHGNIFLDGEHLQNESQELSLLFDRLLTWIDEEYGAENRIRMERLGVAEAGELARSIKGRNARLEPKTLLDLIKRAKPTGSGPEQ